MEMLSKQRTVGELKYLQPCVSLVDFSDNHMTKRKMIKNIIMSHSSIREEDEHPEFIHAFNAYTPPGDVVGDLVFVLS